ncbi:MAG: hypothetical protein AABO57_28500 [Acidobacteriota bacterium]
MKIKNKYDWVLSNAKLFESFGLFLLLGGWLLHTYSIDKWNEADQKLNRSIEQITQNYHLIQITANGRFQSALTRLAVLRPNLAHINDDNYSYENAWSFPEYRKHWLELLNNSVFHLGGITSSLDQTSKELQLDDSPSLQESKKKLEAINIVIREILNGQEYTPEDVPVPELSKVSYERSIEIGKASTEITQYVFSAWEEIMSLIGKKKDSRMVIYYTIFLIGTTLSEASAQGAEIVCFGSLSLTSDPFGMNHSHCARLALLTSISR